MANCIYKYVWLGALLLMAGVARGQQEADDYHQLREVEVVSVKEGAAGTLQLASQTRITRNEMEARHIESLKQASLLVPGLYIPDYGSRLTSAIYIRGVGSRTGTSAVGLVVDDIPLGDKAAFDFNLHDIERIDVLRGPQGTLYGMGTMGGVVRVTTRNPFEQQGTTVKLGYATADRHRTASLTHRRRLTDALALAASGYLEGSSGYFTHDLTGEKVDAMSAAGVRLHVAWRASDAWRARLSANYDYSDEGAYPYYYEGSASGAEPYPDLVGKISNNHEHRYRRAMANVGLNVGRQADHWQMNIIAGYQYLIDRMLMDQDFLQSDIYTLEQRQHIHTFTGEVVAKSRNRERYEWLTGAYGKLGWLCTESPVAFYADGLRWLEGNINTMMPSIDRIPMLQMMGFTGMAVNFRGDRLAMDGTYRTPTRAAALYHQSTLHVADRWSLTAGLRLDYEHRAISYHSPADVAYGFAMPNANNPRMAIDLQQLESHILYDGRLSDEQLRVMPKLAVEYTLGSTGSIYASVQMGQRSGGYNVQMFSDLLQGALRVDMIEGVQTGVGQYMDYLAENNPVMPKYIPDPDAPGQMVYLPDFVRRVMAQNMPKFEVPAIEQIAYRPEYAWNWELGTHLTSSRLGVTFDAAVFYTRIYDQQISRFVPSGLGRMMVNAGKSESLGGEVTLAYRPDRHLALTGNYGYTHAKFVEFDMGDGQDYAGRHVPFMPEHTMNVDAAYSWYPRSIDRVKRITVGMNCSGTGRIYWTEDNTLTQPFYALLGARLGMQFEHLDLLVWGRNLTDADYDTFQFLSMGRRYEQHGKPLNIGIDLTIRF